MSAGRYPPPPWRLVGPAVIATGLVDVDRARPFVPEDLEIVEVTSGRTVAALVVADYQDEATLPYSELGVMAAVVKCGGVCGPWISHIWVDSVPSLEGGREMWGMFKHLASFLWRAGDRNAVTVTAEGQRLVDVTWPAPARLWPAPGRVVGIGSVDGDRRRFTGRGISRMAPIPLTLDIPAESPFFPLGLQDAQVRGVAGRLNLRFGDVRILAPPV